MELSLRLDTLGLVEMRYLRTRERYRDWPHFLMMAASRQTRILAYMQRDVVEQLHQQMLLLEATVGLDVEDDEEDEEEDGDDEDGNGGDKPAEKDGSPFSPAFAQALERLNDLARQRLPEGNVSAPSEAQTNSDELDPLQELSLVDEEDALEQLQDAFVQMMEVVRELAEELSTDALKLTGRFRCARTHIEFIQAEAQAADDEDEETIALPGEQNDLAVEVELVMILQLFEEGRVKPDDLPAVELQLDIDDFERLHETVIDALEHERRRRRQP